MIVSSTIGKIPLIHTFVWFKDDDYYEDDEEDDPDALKDPLYQIDLQVMLKFPLCLCV